MRLKLVEYAGMSAEVYEWNENSKRWDLLKHCDTYDEAREFLSSYLSQYTVVKETIIEV